MPDDRDFWDVQRTVTLVGSLALAAVVAYTIVSYGLGRWHSDVVGARSGQWVARTGQVVQTNHPDYGNGTPDVPSLVQYEGYNGQTRSVWIDMPLDGTHVDEKTEVDVQRDETLYVPSSVDFNNQSQDVGYDAPYPFVASHEFWPVGTDIVGPIVGLLTWVAARIFLDWLLFKLPSPRVRGRVNGPSGGRQ